MDQSPNALPNVLLIDDEVELIDSLARIFNGSGFRTIQAHNADAAEQILREHPIPLILCDVNMPGRSGLELLASIRASGIPSAVVMVTAQEESKLIIEAMQLGALDYIVKPFDIELCVQKLPVWLDVGTRLQALANGGPQTAESLRSQLRMIELMRLKNFADGRVG